MSDHHHTTLHSRIMALSMLALAMLPAGTASGAEDPAPAAPARAAVVDQPAMTVRIEPYYPECASRYGIEGHVTLQFTIAADGTVSDIVVLESEPGTLFVEAATKAVSRWRFKPMIVDGQPVPTRAVQTIEFNLEQ
ncbi:MAG: hypothetical protein Kow0020_05440 [Wenzhouxiangellaceae bacterium]